MNDHGFTMLWSNIYVVQNHQVSQTGIFGHFWPLGFMFDTPASKSR